MIFLFAFISVVFGTIGVIRGGQHGFQNYWEFEGDSIPANASSCPLSALKAFPTPSYPLLEFEVAFTTVDDNAFAVAPAVGDASNVLMKWKVGSTEKPIVVAKDLPTLQDAGAQLFHFQQKNLLILYTTNGVANFTAFHLDSNKLVELGSYTSKIPSPVYTSGVLCDGLYIFVLFSVLPSSSSSGGIYFSAFEFLHGDVNQLLYFDIMTQKTTVIGSGVGFIAGPSCCRNGSVYAFDGAGFETAGTSMIKIDTTTNKVSSYGGSFAGGYFEMEGGSHSVFLNNSWVLTSSRVTGVNTGVSNQLLFVDLEKLTVSFCLVPNPNNDALLPTVFSFKQNI